MTFEAHRTGFDLLDQRLLAVAVALAEKTDIDRQAFAGAEHHSNIVRARRHRRGIGAVGGAGAAADQRRRSIGECRIGLLWRDEMDVRVDTRRGEDQVRARNGVGADAELEPRRHPVHGLRIAGLADAADAPVLDADIGFHHAEHGVDDGNIGDDEIGRPGRAREPVIHAHTFAEALATAEHHFVAETAAQVALDFHKQIAVAEANAIADRGAVKAHIFIA